MASSQLSQFLLSHSMKNVAEEKEGGNKKEITNTRIGGTGVIPNSYHISQEEYSHFMKIYFRECIAGNKKEYLTETQLKENGPILVDIDFRYPLDVRERKHNDKHIEDIAKLYI